MNVLECQHLTKLFGFRQVLKDIHFEISPNESVHIKGENGSGKTTLLKMIASLVKPTSGRILLWGEDTTHHRSTFRARLGVLFAETYFYPELTLYENLSIYARLYQIPNQRSRIVETLDLLHMARLQDQRVSTFSRGERQRASLIRSILHQPEFLIWDEPFVGLDHKAKEAVHQIISIFRAKTTFLIVTHENELQQREVDRSLTLSNGMITS